MKYLIIILWMMAVQAFAEDSKNIHPAGNDIYPRQSSEDEYLTIDGIRYKNNKSSTPSQDNVRDKKGKDPHQGKNYEGYPYYGNPHGFKSKKRSHSQTVIIKEKETIREIVKEVPVAVPQEVKERKWVPPVYTKKTIPGHYITGILETVDEKGVRTFTDDDTVREWVPEKTIWVVTTPGYYE